MSEPVWSLGTPPWGIVARQCSHGWSGRVNSAVVRTGPGRRLSCAPVLSVLALSLDPKQIFDSLSPYGEIGLILIIFAETGLLIGFFLPGDSLLFTAGLLADQGRLNLAAVLAGSFVAAVLGNMTGFFIGERAGPRLFRRGDSRFFKQEYVEQTHQFFERHGPKTIVLARFVPIVRTFAAVLAGVAAMPRRAFFAYSAIGAVLWVFGVTMAGYLLSDAIGDSVDTYLLPIIGAIVVLSLIPPFLEWRKSKKHPAHAVTEAEAEAEAAELHTLVDDD